MILHSDSRIVLRTLFGEWILLVALLGIAIVVSTVLNYTVPPSFYWTTLLLVLARLVDQLSTNRLTTLEFNDETGQIVFRYKAIAGQRRERCIDIGGATMELKCKRSIGKEDVIQRIYFLRDKWEAFELSESKDGFTQAELKNIVEEARKENVSIRIL